MLADLPSRCQTTGQSRPSMLVPPVLLAARLFGRVCRVKAKLAPRSLREPGHGGLGPGTAGIEEDERAQSAQGEARTAGPLTPVTKGLSRAFVDTRIPQVRAP
jgi:hypothetical protein